MICRREERNQGTCISLLSLKRILWGEKKTKAQLLLHRPKEGEQLSVHGVRFRSAITPTIRDSSLNFRLSKVRT